METKSKKAQLLEESCGVCIYCGHKVNESTMEIEHIMPLAKGGSSNLDNLVCSCHGCNAEKKDMYPQEFVALMTERRRTAFRNRLNHLVKSARMTQAKCQLLLSGILKPAEAKPAEINEVKPAEVKPVEVNEDKPSEVKPVEVKTSENKTSEEKTSVQDMRIELGQIAGKKLYLSLSLSVVG